MRDQTLRETLNNYVKCNVEETAQNWSWVMFNTFGDQLELVQDGPKVPPLQR